MRYLAIDYGSKRTGLAVCDASETVASPLGAIQGQKGLFEKITHIVEEEHIEAIVVGLPLNMDNSKGTQAKLVLEFVERLKSYVDIPVYFQDERLSSFSAEEKLSTEYSKVKRKKRVDAVAAATILEAFIEAKKSK
jgi:putative Holliday junction resolvase